MISKERIQADMLDRTLQRMLEGNPALEDSTPGEAGAVSEVRSLLEAATRMREVLTAHSPSPEFIAASETRLLRKIKASSKSPARRESRPAGQARWGWLRSAALAAVATVIVMGASGLGVASASAQALPGDLLYPVKQGVEEISLALSLSATGDVGLLADFADGRLEEIERLAGTNRETDLITGLDNYDRTLNRLDDALDQLPAGAESAQLMDIQARLARHTEALATLRDRLTEHVRSALDRAVEHSKRSRERVGRLQKNQGPDEVSPGQDKQSTQDTGKGDDASSPTDKKPDSDPGTDTPEPTNTPKPSKTPKLTKTPKPSKTPEPPRTIKPPKPSKDPK